MDYFVFQFFSIQSDSFLLFTSIYINIYICIYINIYHIYIYILSSTNRLFRCITTLQCSYTREMLQAGIETRLSLRQSDILPQRYLHFQRKQRNFLRIFFLHIRYRLPKCSIHEIRKRVRLPNDVLNIILNYLIETFQSWSLGEHGVLFRCYFSRTHSNPKW